MKGIKLFAAEEMKLKRKLKLLGMKWRGENAGRTIFDDDSRMILGDLYRIRNPTEWD